MADPQVPAPILYNTGADDRKKVLPPGAPDAHWNVSGPGCPDWAPARLLLMAPSTYYRPTESSWIWIGAAGTSGLPDKNYTFRLRFDLTDFDPATAKITGFWGVDNSGTIVLNSESQGIGSGTLSLPGDRASNYGQPWPFTLDANFIAGINTLDFVVKNTGGAGGLNVQGLAATAEVKYESPAAQTSGPSGAGQQASALVPPKQVGRFVDVEVSFKTPIINSSGLAVKSHIAFFKDDLCYHMGIDDTFKNTFVAKQSWTTAVLGFKDSKTVIVRVWRNPLQETTSQPLDPASEDIKDPNWPGGVGVVVVVTPTTG